MSERFFFTRPSGPREWGLLGYHLAYCENVSRDLNTGLLHVDCIGPAMLPVMGASDYFVTSSEFRDWLLAAGLGQFTFQAVVKERVVEVPWGDWDPDSEDSIPIPGDVDLESYFSELPHSDRAATALRDVWEWIITPGAVMDCDIPVANSSHRFQMRIHLGSWNGADIFRAGTSPDQVDGELFVTERAKSKIESKWPRCFAFTESLVLSSGG